MQPYLNSARLNNDDWSSLKSVCNPFLTKGPKYLHIKSKVCMSGLLLVAFVGSWQYKHLDWSPGDAMSNYSTPVLPACFSQNEREERQFEACQARHCLEGGRTEGTLNKGHDT